MDERKEVKGDLILVPSADGYKIFPLSIILGSHVGMLGDVMGQGLPSLRFITHSSPYQHGTSVSGMRYNDRVMQIVIKKSVHTHDLFSKLRRELVTMLTPSRSFISPDGKVKPFIYRKVTYHDDIVRGSSLQALNGSPDVIVPNGKFIHYGGLTSGNAIYINNVKYIIDVVHNDFELTLTEDFADIDGTYHWYYQAVKDIREIPFILEEGLNFNQENPRVSPFGYEEVLRLRCHYPLWSGDWQERVWKLSDRISDLVFDGMGAWFGGSHSGAGRWLFKEEYVSENVDLIYLGNEISRPIITIFGPAELPTITNNTTSQQLFLNYRILAGETITIDVSKISAVSSTGENLLGYLRGNLATFGIVPEGAASNGINQMNISFGGATSSSRATMAYRNIYGES